MGYFGKGSLPGLCVIRCAVQKASQRIRILVSIGERVCYNFRFLFRVVVEIRFEGLAPCLL